MININWISIGILLFFFNSLIFLSIFLIGIKILEKFHYVKHYEKYISLFNFYLEETYDSIYKKHLINYFSKGENLNNIQIENITRIFIHSVLTNMGPIQTKIFINFFGNYDTLVINIMNYIQKRIDYDEIKKKILDQKNLIG